ncbi:MAG: TonB-dependent receptor [Phaeodactylibacter sp.]|nr:TonB-dependent receptor [Phaeodactylibacter sp.]MCB9049578.1 TonB-dependent receptor [Lewinellaceae bacterium]
MEKQLRSILTGCLLAVWSVILSGLTPLAAQPLDSLQVSAQGRHQGLAALFAQWERQHAVRFFYTPGSLPTAPIEPTFEAKPLPDALDGLLSGTGLGYFFYRDYAVAVAPHNILESTFSAEYYRALAQASASGQTESNERQAEVLEIGDILELRPDGRAIIQGIITDEENGEPITGATILWGEQGTDSDVNGRFELNLPTGQHELQVQYVGYAPLQRTVKVYGNGELRLALRSAATNLAEVLVKAESTDANVSNARIGVTRLEVKSIERLPTLLGEADVVRSLLLSAGVTTIGEGSAGFNVRGGEIDQNLMLQDEAIIFNATHALGFFSTFNTDLTSNVELYKSIIPARYGGRLASVLDVEMREGNFEKWKFKAGISPVSGRLSVEGPAIKGKSSIIAGVRASYSDWVLGLANRPELKRSSASFYDANLRYTHRLDNKNTLSLAGYLAGDEFEYNKSFGFNYNTRSGQLIFKRIHNDNFFSRLSAAASRYNSTQSNLEGADGGQVDNGIAYYKLKEVLTYTFGRSLQLDGGIEGIFYRVDPGEQRPLGATSVVLSKVLASQQAMEGAVFAGAEWAPSPRLAIIGGLRFNHYRFLGPGSVATYNGPPSPENRQDTVTYGKGKTIVAYTYLEPRFSARYRVGTTASFKAGYSRTSQFINQIFNTDTPTPTSQYQLSTEYIRPFRSHNFAGGYFRNTQDNKWEGSAELFYRVIDQLWDYRDFARLLVNENLETEILNGRGRAYGMELSLKTTRDLINGQLSYTWSRTERQIEGINRGSWYPSNFDKPHNLNLVVNYQPSQRHTVTFNFTYSTGRPTTAPLSTHRLSNAIIVPLYSLRNQLRIPDYHRLDISYTVGRGYNKNKTLKTSWNFSVYNVYARKNAFSVFFTPGPGLETVANRLAILGSAFPAITINITTL